MRCLQGMAAVAAVFFAAMPCHAQLCRGAPAVAHEQAPSAGSMPIAGAPSGATAADTAEAAFLDSLMTAQQVFPGRAQRARYDRSPPCIEDTQRLVVFQLKPQRGMRAGRHFHIVMLAFAPPGTFVEGCTKAPVMTSAAGPHGGFTALSMRTHDGAYDVRVSQGMLLPNSVSTPVFSTQQALAALLRRYERGRGTPLSSVRGSTCVPPLPTGEAARPPRQ